jgi:hypothetical protein
LARTRNGASSGTSLTTALRPSPPLGSYAPRSKPPSTGEAMRAVSRSGCSPRPPNALLDGSGVTHDLNVHFVRAEAVRWVDHELPAWVEVQLRESNGTIVSLVDKAPIFDEAERLTPGPRFQWTSRLRAGHRRTGRRRRCDGAGRSISPSGPYCRARLRGITR